MKQPVSNNDTLRQKILKEWEDFTNQTLLCDKRTILNMCDKILFYDCAMIFFSENGQIPECVCDFLIHKEKIISKMWKIYLTYENLGFLTWKELEELLEVWMQI